MNKQTIITILLALVAMSADAQRLNKDVERLQYVYSLKVVINDSVWSGFADKQYDVPLLYYGQSFYKLRNERRERVKKELGIDIVALEQLYETMEGSARYIEYCLYRHFGNFNLSDANWLYNVGRKYYYATGFNLLRISDKLKIDYKHMIFKDVSAIEGNLRAAHQR